MDLGDLAWEHDGGGWSASVGGACPVQGDGRVDGLPFYFRARGDGWAFRIAAKPDGDPVGVGWRDGPSGWVAEGDYGGFPDAGWMVAEYSRAIVEACVRRWREVRAEAIDESGVMFFAVTGVPELPGDRGGDR